MNRITSYNVCYTKLLRIWKALYIFKILEGYKGGGMSGFSIRFGEEKDLEALTNIYNYYVEHTTITFDIEIYTVERRKQWFEKYDKNGPYKLLVAENGGRVLGYATSSKLSYNFV